MDINICIYIYNYDLFTLTYGRDHHNIVKQLFPNKKRYKKKRTVFLQANATACFIASPLNLDRLLSGCCLKFSH